MASYEQVAVVNSSLGVLSHYDSYCVRRVLVAKSRLGELGRVSEDGLRFYPNALDWVCNTPSSVVRGRSGF